MHRNYLRARGEYHQAGGGWGWGVELPPRTRRIHWRFNACSCWHGTTSAHAENTKGFSPIRLSRRNYLRARGEYHHRVDFRLGDGELPPRTRRIRNLSAFRLGFLGTTSAHAENTAARQQQLGSVRNYLRARGEYFLSEAIKEGREELPPRTRRILNKCPCTIVNTGTTSAHAENTLNELGLL